MNRIFLITFLLVLSGCSGIDTALSDRGVVTTYDSKFEKEKIVSMSPAMTDHGGSYPEFGLYWEESYGGYARLIVQMTSIENFSRKNNLEIIIDGEHFSLKPVDSNRFGNIDFNKYSAEATTQKDFLISKAQILQIATGKEGAFRVHFVDGYLDGDINYDYQNYQSYIPKPFREFHSIAWGDE